MNPEGMEGQLP